MEKTYNEKIQDERGEVMLESAIVIVPVLILLMALLSISFMFYQQSVINSVANEIAADIAKNYKFTELDMGSNSVTLSDVNNTNMFRMSFGQNNARHSHQDRAEDYVLWRAPLTSLGLHPHSADVECVIKRSGIGRAYVKVTVSQKSDFFLSGVLDMAGVADEDTLFTSTAYAECLDFMSYTSMVNFTEYASNRLSVFNSIGGFYDSVKNLVQKLMG